MQHKKIEIHLQENKTTYCQIRKVASWLPILKDMIQKKINKSGVGQLMF